MPSGYAALPGVLTARTACGVARDAGRASTASARCRRARLRLSAAAAFARLSHRAQFRPRRDSRRSRGSVAEPAGRRAARDRISRCARQGRQRAQIPRDDDRRENSIRCIWRFRETGRCIISPPTWPTTRTIAPRKRHSWPTCRRRSATRPCRASAAIQAALGLDYAGIDFGLARDGDLLLFEANATMVIAQPDNDAHWAYRRGAISAVIDAVVAMIKEKAARASCPGSDIRTLSRRHFCECQNQRDPGKRYPILETLRSQTPANMPMCGLRGRKLTA